ncbi:MAG TPA: archaetidylserine decarboxylase, partial [Gammaproteobacteria bacterium]|nr:archaetidylserine decarboxylase [Gammaproteobacteria bacterium]
MIKSSTRLQYILPQHLLSRLFGKLLQSKNVWVKNTLIKMFIAHFKVNMDEVCDPHPNDYACFNDFFIRTLKKDARPIASAPDAMASPVDGTIAQMGIAQQDQLIQAKNHNFSLTDLLGGDKVMAEDFLNGPYTTIYLGPRDYHRVHMPIDGTLKKMIFVPGKLFSVNRSTVDDVNNLFARNERVICLFETDAGPHALIMVGA